MFDNFFILDIDEFISQINSEYSLNTYSSNAFVDANVWHARIGHRTKLNDVVST